MVYRNDFIFPFKNRNGKVMSPAIKLNRPGVSCCDVFLFCSIKRINAQLPVVLKTKFFKESSL